MADESVASFVYGWSFDDYSYDSAADASGKFSSVSVAILLDSSEEFVVPDGSDYDSVVSCWFVSAGV